jgi:hypothetical protein
LKHHEEIKAITEYPVFIVTVVALASIMILSSHILSAIVSTEYTTSNSARIIVDYIAENSKIYVKTNIRQPLYELALLKNKSTLNYKLNPISRDIYGPLEIPENTTTIILYTLTHSRINIIDILKTITGPLHAQISFNDLPPSTIISLDKNTVEPAAQPGGKYTYYRLEPYTFKEETVLQEGLIYNTSITGQVKVLGKTGYIEVNNNTTDQNNITSIIAGNTVKYGRIRLNLTIPLNIYPNQDYTMPNQLYFMVNSSAKPIIILTKKVDLGTIKTTQLNTVWIGIKASISGITFRDNHQRTYPAVSEVIEEIDAYNALNDTQTRIYTYEDDIGTNTSVTISPHVKIWINGTVSLTFTVKIIVKPTYYIGNGPFSGSATLILQPALSGGYYARTFFPDTVTIASTTGRRTLIPLDNQTINMTITGRKGVGQYNVTINKSFGMKAEEIEYSPIKQETFEYTVEAYPTNIIMRPANIELIIENGILEYNTRIGEALYYESQNTTLTMVVKPAVKINNTLLVESNSILHIVVIGNETIMYDGRSLFSAETGSFSAYNYMVDYSIRYTQPILKINNRLNVTVENVVIEANGENIIVGKPPEAITVPNTVIKQVRLEIEAIPGNTTILASLTGKIIIDSDREAAVLSFRKTITLGDTIYIYTTINGRGILVPLNNTFTQPTSI